jgi:pilus assembly protein CpaB
VLVLAAGQIFTRPEEKAVQGRTVTLAVTPDQVDQLVAARAKGPLSLSLRGVNDHLIVEQPKPSKPVEDEVEKLRRIKLEKEREKEREEDKAQRLKLERELAEVRTALAKLSEPRPLPLPPPPPPPPAAPPKPPARRYVAIYHGPDNLVRISVDDSSVKELVQAPKPAPGARRSTTALAESGPFDEAEEAGPLTAPEN